MKIIKPRISRSLNISFSDDSCDHLIYFNFCIFDGVTLLITPISHLTWSYLCCKALPFFGQWAYSLRNLPSSVVDQGSQHLVIWPCCHHSSWRWKRKRHRNLVGVPLVRLAPSYQTTTTGFLGALGYLTEDSIQNEGQKQVRFL